MGFGPFRLIKGLIILALASVILGALVMLLWNALVPDIFHGPMLGYWQAVGLFVLSKLLIGHFPGGGGRRGNWGKKKWQGQRCEVRPGDGKWSWTMTAEDSDASGGEK